MGKEFYYSVNLLSKEESEIWNSNHTLEEVHANRQALIKQASKQIPKAELPQWILVDLLGLLGNSLHDVYITFKLSWLLTHKGRRRRLSRALKMMGVPFIKVKWVTSGLEKADDGFEVVNIPKLKGGKQ